MEKLFLEMVSKVIFVSGPLCLWKDVHDSHLGDVEWRVEAFWDGNFHQGFLKDRRVVVHVSHGDQDFLQKI